MQALDALWDDVLYGLVGINGGGLFHPARLGLRTARFSPEHKRGYWCRYAIEDEALYLAEVHLGIAGDEPPELFSVTPEKGRYGQFVYRDLWQPIDFSGTLLGGEQFVMVLDEKIAFPAPWMFQRLFEFEFDEGRLTGRTDRSEAADVIRKARAARAWLRRDKDELQDEYGAHYGLGKL